MHTRNRQKHSLLYPILKYASLVMTGIAVTALVAVLVYVFADGAGKVSFHFLFGRSTPLDPTLLPALTGTVWLVLIACGIALPLGIGCAVFLVEYAGREGRLVSMIRVAVETLAGIPSIVYGLFGYLAFVVTLGWGYSLLAGGITLSMMILPVVVRSAEESLLAVPAAYREGAYEMGAGKARTVFRIVLPSAMPGIVTAVILAAGRVISESAVLILTIGMSVEKMPADLLCPGTSLALDIYYFAGNGFPDKAAATSVVLLVFVLALDLLAGAVGRMFTKKTGDLK